MSDEQQEETVLTWEMVEAYLQNMTPEQKKKPVLVAVDDESRFKTLAEIHEIQEDVYVHQDDDEEVGTLEDLKSMQDSKGEEFKESEYRLCTPKGTPFLYLEVNM